MSHRVYRLSIQPEISPDVHRVVDVDGRSTLGALHDLILQSFGLPFADDLYGFSMSGRFDDGKGVYVGPGAEGQKAERALLFRLGLQVGKTFSYLLDSSSGGGFKVSVLGVTEVEQPLAYPALVESVGVLTYEPAGADDAQQGEPADVAALVPLAEAFLDLHDELEPFEEELTHLRARLEPWEHETAADDGEVAVNAARVDDSVPSAAVPILRVSASAALSLLEAVSQELPRFLRLDDWLLERSLGQRLLDLPLDLSAIGEHDLALEVSRAITFVDPELTRGDTAIILARAGRGAEALAQLDVNLSEARDKSLVEAKAGDVHRALGDLAAAEAYYRRSLIEATTEFDRRQATLRLVSCLLDSDRAVEANQLLAAERALTPAGGAVAKGPALGSSATGRNEPCPCGSGKKYKKCHGASS